jgi:creatinine amidohydrolase
MFLSTCSWFSALDKKIYFDNQGDHADEMETSLILHLAPHLVLPLTEAGDGKEKKNKIAAFREGWVWAERKWSQVTEDTGIGDPSLSTAVKGEQYFNAVTKKIGDMLVQLAACDINDLYA